MAHQHWSDTPAGRDFLSKMGETSGAMRRLADSLDALSTDLALAFHDTPFDEDGELEPSLLMAASAVDQANVELALIRAHHSQTRLPLR